MSPITLADCEVSVPRFVLLIMAMALCAAGCDMGASRLEEEARKQEEYAQRKIRLPKPIPPPSDEDVRPGLELIEDAWRTTQPNLLSIGHPEEVAVRRITQAIDASLELGPTLVVWLIDRTPSSEALVTPALSAARRYYDSAPVRQRSKDHTDSLLTAVVAFDEQPEFVVDPPSGDPRAVTAALGNIRPASGGREMTFTAIKQALDKYLPYRTDERREVLLIAITDEAGDDPQLADDAIAIARRQAIPVYVVGLAAPWGQTSPFAPEPKAADAATADDALPRVGPESLFTERVDLDGWSAGYAARPNFDLVDSGFGPFALEKLCRASRGQFFAVRPEVNEYGYAVGGLRFRTWPPGSELRFDEAVVSRYAPDYVSEADYQKLLAENKARQALHEAAKLPKLSIEGLPDTRFAKAAEAQMARNLSRAQQFAAQHSPGVDRLHAILAAGEGDRDRLTGPRWQAQFDLSIGRVLAIKARLDGYNSMIAALKRGRSFENEASTMWVLEPADAFETESTIKRHAERARMYLDRVVQDHPGTPWATIAEHELKTPLGWTWREE